MAFAPRATAVAHDKLSADGWGVLGVTIVGIVAASFLGLRQAEVQKKQAEVQEKQAEVQEMVAKWQRDDFDAKAQTRAEKMRHTAAQGPRRLVMWRAVTLYYAASTVLHSLDEEAVAIDGGVRSAAERRLRFEDAVNTARSWLVQARARAAHIDAKVLGTWEPDLAHRIDLRLADASSYWHAVLGDKVAATQLDKALAWLAHSETAGPTGSIDHALSVSAGHPDAASEIGTDDLETSSRQTFRAAMTSLIDATARGPEAHPRAQAP
ncbi:hypothetical protein FNF28_04101 [Cafeteria roenbergensis]|uniref:Uncharacterized protein n=1 Tax=Cafeteria roenbergensis TaxID=33653 RepID=A0A5A8DHN2_CAFRO|nr:hypothetical protein FNF28_04101 [Cafeteria roenbergensis]